MDWNNNLRRAAVAATAAIVRRGAIAGNFEEWIEAAVAATAAIVRRPDLIREVKGDGLAAVAATAAIVRRSSESHAEQVPVCRSRRDCGNREADRDVGKQN